MKKLWAKRKIFLLLFAVVLSFTAYFFWQKKKAPTPPTPTPVSQQATWKELVPGTSTKEEAIDKLGKPMAESASLLEFESASPTRNHSVSLEGNTVSLIIEIVSFRDTTKIDDVKSKYGETSDILYGPEAENGYYLFVYPEKGIAYLGNPATGNLLEVWYFPATTIEDFMKKWAPAYSESLIPKF